MKSLLRKQKRNLILSGLVGSLLGLMQLTGCKTASGDNLPELFLLDALIPPEYTLSIKVNEYYGSDLTFQNRPVYNAVLNDGPETEDLLIESGTSEGTFTQKFQVTDQYEVSVFTHPYTPTQLCSMTDRSTPASGEFGNGEINLEYNCEGAYRISGAISGLSGEGLLLTESGGEANGGQELTPVAGDSAYELPVPLILNSSYDLAIATQPTNPWQTCQFTASSSTTESGSWSSGDNLIRDIACTTDQFAVTLDITSLDYDGLEVQYNSEAPITFTAGPQTHDFGMRNSGTGYNLQLTSVPAGATCTVSNASGTITDHAETITVDCPTDGYRISGAITGLTASGLSLSMDVNSGGSTQTVSPASGVNSYQFPDLLVYNDTYSISIVTHPTGLDCLFDSNHNGVFDSATDATTLSGTATAPVSDADVVCSVAAPQVPSPTITMNSKTATSFDLSWSQATDNIDAHSSLTYTVYISDRPNLASPTDITANGTSKVSATGITSASITSLNTGATYYYNVLVTDTDGNENVYATGSVTTPMSAFDWQYVAGDTSNQEALAAALLDSEVIIAGDSFSNLFGTYSNNDRDIFTIKLDTTGTYVAGIQEDGGMDDHAADLCVVDPANEVFFTLFDRLKSGWVYEPTLLYHKPLGTTNTSYADDSQLPEPPHKFAIACETDGAYVYSVFNYPPTDFDHNVRVSARQVSTTMNWKSATNFTLPSGLQGYDNLATDAAIAPDNSKLYITGYTSNDIDGDGGSEYPFVAVVGLDGSGNFTGTTYHQFGQAGDTPASITVDSAGNMYVLLKSSNTVNGVAPINGQDAFLVKLAPDFTHQWTTIVRGASVEDKPVDVEINEGVPRLYVFGQYKMADSNAYYNVFVRYIDPSTGNVVHGYDFGSDQGNTYATDMTISSGATTLIVGTGYYVTDFEGAASSGGNDIYAFALTD